MAATGPLRIEPGPTQRRVATVAQWLLGGFVLALLWAGGRIVGLFWLERADPAVGGALWLFVGIVTCAALTLAWLAVLLQDLVKMTIDITDEGVAVHRLLAPFRAQWDEVREIGLLTARGHLTLRTARGSLTATARLLGQPAFDHLVAGLRERAPHAVQEWTAWEAARRQLVVFAVPVLGLALLVYAGQGIWRRRLPILGSARGRR
jgi:hypothetical protein